MKLSLNLIKEFLVFVMSMLILGACGNTGSNLSPKYTITYNANGATGGSVPFDTNIYLRGQSVMVLGNTGNLVNTGKNFAGWNTAADGSGQTYSQTQVFTMGAANVTLYAVWSVYPLYTVTYNGNGATGGSIPIDPATYSQGQVVNVLGNTGNLVNTGFHFSGWNTAADGSGTTYVQGEFFQMGTSNVTLYAVWTLNTSSPVTYIGNGATGGSAPVDSTNYTEGQTVRVLGNTGNLVNTGYNFAGWNTRPDGSGTTYIQGQSFTMPATNVILYAMWISTTTYTVTYNANGATGGSVPVDTTQYTQGQSVIVRGNTGNLVNTGYSFAGWDMQSDGTGTIYAQGQTFKMGPANVNLYAVWYQNTSGYSYTYVADWTDNNILGYAIGADGSLTQLPTIITTGASPNFIAVHPTYKYLYTANFDSNSISQYTIGSDGSLAPMNPTTAATGTNPTSIAFDSWGRYAYVTNNGSDTVSQYTVGADGSLTLMSPATVPAGMYPNAIAIAPSGKNAYAVNEASWDSNSASIGSISQYTIGIDGKLTPMSPATVATGVLPYSIVVDPMGLCVYAANYIDSTVSQYTIGADGSLTPMSQATVSTGTNPTSIAIEHTGKYVYVTNEGSNDVWQYNIGLGGELVHITTSLAGTMPFSIAIDSSASYAYVANWSSNNVSQFTINSVGSLTSMYRTWPYGPPRQPAVTAGNNPVSVITVIGY